MKLIQTIAEAANNAAQATEALHQAVVNGKDTSTAQKELAAIVGHAKAQQVLNLARKAVAEKEAREGSVKESKWGREVVGTKLDEVAATNAAAAHENLSQAMQAHHQGKGGKRVCDDAHAELAKHIGQEKADIARVAIKKALMGK